MIRIITDSTCDLRPAQREALGVEVVPLSVHFGEEALQDGIDITNEEFYRRLQLAFGWLEEQAQMGRIGCYGISSNTLPHASEHPEFVSLARAMSFL